MSKRPLSAYNYFTKDTELREKIKNENPDWSNSKIMAHLGELWRDMDDTSKSPYLAKASDEKKNWIPIEENPPKKVEIKTRNKKAKSPYFQYLYDPAVRKPIQDENPEWKPKQLTTAIATKWNSLTDEQKKPWIKKTETEKLELIANPILVQVKNKPKPVKESDDRIYNLEKDNKDFEKRIAILENEVENLKKLLIEKNSD